MAITDNETAFIDAGGVSIGLSQMFTVTPAASDPAYLVLTALDRNEYTTGYTNAASGVTGTLSGNGHVLNLSGLGGDGRGAGIIFTYQASTGRYLNSTYGYLDQLTYTSSTSLSDVTNLSLFGVSNSTLANACVSNGYVSNPYAMMQVDAAGYLGSATIATQPHFTASVPTQATPNSVAAVANSFVGQAWNENGCWVLASTIAAEAGASLPVQSTLIGLPGQANGEWIVAYNGPAGQSGNWQSMVTAGEVVVIGTSGGGGHITTCVSGSGATAMLVDNITYVNGSGQVLNPAGDGSSSDIKISAAHLASQEWSGVAASSVVIYELDTPIVTDTVSSDKLALGASQSLGSLFNATDPANRTITSWQVYDTASSDWLVVGGTKYSDHTAAAVLTTTSLASVSLLAGTAATTDTLEVRAFNGLYWGDWQSLAVTVAGSATAVAAPVLAAQTPTQTWTANKTFSFALPAGTFTDPQSQALTYTATQSNGTALPSWLTFNAKTETFSGIAPITTTTIGITVKATDTSGLSASENFSAIVQAAAPVLTYPTANQIWTEGKSVSLALPATTFTDPQGEALTYTATQSNGTALPGWLTFNAGTETFSGTAPITATTIGITVKAIDASGLSTSESFSATVQPASPVLAHQTANQSWTAGKAVSFILPANTFTDPQGQALTYTAYEISGPNVTSWLHFSSAGVFSGNVPASLSTTIGIQVVATDTSHLSAAETFSVTFGAASSHVTVPGSVSVAALSQLAFHS